MTKYTITKNQQFNSIEISFDGKPSEAIREALKALRFRWHGVKKVWYGYASEEEARKAITSADAGTAPERSNSNTQAATATAQNHIKLYYNGMKIDGGTLIRCGYSLDNRADGAECVTIYARDYKDLPRDLFDVVNESDSYTDYFEEDRATVRPDHPLYKYVRYVAEKAQAKTDARRIEYLNKRIAERESWRGQHASYTEEINRRTASIKKFEGMKDPGQPTAEDLAKIDAARQEAENARREAERLEELKRREEFLNNRANDLRLIRTETEAHPLKAGEPAVIIEWSENAALNDISMECGTHQVLSITAADRILGQIDTRNHSNDQKGYDKTKFSILGNNPETGEEVSYTGRYDLGDGENGLINHIYNLGEWERTHNECGHDISNPEPTNDRIEFARYLKSFTLS